MRAPKNSVSDGQLIGFRIPTDELERFDKVVKEWGMSRTLLIRAAIAYSMENPEAFSVGIPKLFTGITPPTNSE